MSYAVILRAVTAGQFNRAVRIGAPGSEHSVDGSSLTQMIDVFERHPRAPQIYLEWLHHSVDANRMERCNVSKATPAKVALRALRKMEATVRRFRAGYRQHYTLEAKSAEAGVWLPSGSQVEHLGQTYQVVFDWDCCYAARVPRKRGQKVIDLRQANGWQCSAGNRLLTVVTRSTTYAEMFGPDLRAMCHVAEVADAEGGYVLVGAA